MSRTFTHITAVVIAAGLFAALLFLLAGAPPTLAQITPANPDVPGSIAGVITNEAGAPVAGAEVQLFRQDVSGWVPTRIMRSDDSAGAYRAALLATGAYRVLVRDPAGVYAQGYYPDALTFDDATSIMVAGADVGGIDVMLRRGGAITGVYSNTNPYSIYARIVAVTRSRGLWQEVAVVWLDATGGYSLTGLQPAVYRVCAYAPPYSYDGLPPPTVCYRDIVSAIDNADDVTVTAGVTTTAIDLTVGVPGDGATIGGQVRSPAGVPLGEIDAILFQQDAQQNVFNVGAVKTDAQGAYTFRGLRPGRYVMQFADLVGPYVTTYYSATTWIHEATPIVVAVREERLDVDATLPVGGILTGALSILTDTAPAWAYVNLYSASESGQSLQYDASDSAATQPMKWAKNQNGAYPQYYASYDAATGHYRINAVPPGQYYIFATAQIDQLTFSGFYGADDLTPRAVVTVTAGAVLTDLDINLGLGAFEGVIAGRVTAGGQPLPGIKASLLRTESYGVQEIVHVFTGADGRYAIGGLMAGAYRMGFSDPAGIYATQYYSQAVHPQAGESINLAPAGQQLAIDAALELGGAVAGRISLDDNAPAVGYIVRFYREISRPWLELVEMPLRATTDEAGAYRMAGLAPGAYRVCTSATETEWSTPRGCFGGPPLADQPYTAESVWVRAGEETANIDIDLGQPDPPVAYLPLVARQVAPTMPFSATVLVSAGIHSCPSAICPVIDAVLAGTVVTVNACNETCTWYQLDTGGWIPAEVLAPLSLTGRTTP